MFPEYIVHTLSCYMDIYLFIYLVSFKLLTGTDHVSSYSNKHEYMLFNAKLVSLSFEYFLFFFLLFSAHPRHMEVPRLGVELELQLP